MATNEFDKFMKFAFQKENVYLGIIIVCVIVLVYWIKRVTKRFVRLFRSEKFEDEEKIEESSSSRIPDWSIALIVIGSLFVLSIVIEKLHMYKLRV